MTCIHIPGGIMCVSPFYRLRLADGRCVFMDWHNYHGPTFYHDKASRRMIVDWYEYPLICDALNWFSRRGHRA